MNKSSFFLIVSTLVLNTAPCLSQQNSLHRFYCGISMGGQNVTAQSERHDQTNSNDTEAKLAGYGLQAAVLAGYGNFVIPNIHLGLEAKFDWSNTKLNFIFNNQDPASANLHVKETMGLAGRLGFVFHKDSIVYAKLGLAATSMALTMVEGEKNNTTRKRLYGTEIGLGMTVPITDKLSLGTEMSHTRYQKIDCLIDEYAYYKMRPQTNHFSLRLIYCL